MKKAAIALCLGLAGTLAADPIEQALEELDVTRAELRVDPAILLSSRDSAGQTALLRACLADPLRAPWRIGTTERRFASRTDSVHRLLMYTGSLAGADIARGYLDNPLAAIDDGVVRASDPLEWAVGLSGGDTTALPGAGDFPNPMRAELARLVGAAAQANAFLERALRKLPADLTKEKLLQQVLDGRPQDGALDFRLLVPEIEREALVAGLLDLTAAVEDFEVFLRSAPELPAIDFEVETPHGTIVFRGTKAPHRHTGRAPLLSIDLDGDDVWTATECGPISVVIDGAGNDVYEGVFASGVLGYGVVWDLAGDDRYMGDSVTQAGAIFGGALLVDREGSDRYTAKRYAQGAALGGVALLVDGGGADEYRSLTASQGSGGPGAGAALLDLEGSDLYDMTGGPVVRPAPQLSGVNSSQGQGCGWGLRADLSDGRSLAGGIGFLMDLAGDDRYRADVFAQGTGFQEGLGALVDHAGNDSYEASWYGMASGAHRAVGVLIDRAGDDTFTASHYTSVAAGHDGSAAALVDEAGNDRYRVRNLGLGGAHDGGFAILADNAGNDVYTLHDKEAHGLGSARITHYGTAREEAPSLGLFLDGGGDDRYELRRTGPANDAMWSGAAAYPELVLPSERGVGLDGSWEAPFLTQPRTPAGKEDEKMLRGAEKSRRAWRARISSGDSK